MTGIQLRDTLALRLIGFATAPVIAFVGPRVLQNDDEAMRLVIPLGYRTRNHVGSMYFGVLAIGADLVCGLPVIRLMRERGQEVAPVMKEFRAEFLRRAVGDVVFETRDVPAIVSSFDEAVRSGQRVELPVHVVGTVPADKSGEPVVRFTATLSMKHRPNEKPSFLRRVLSKL